MTEENIQKVTEYVYKNYRSFNKKPLIIKEYDKCIHVLLHKDGSPLILGKSILK